jgi:hypothetical protein
MSEMKRAAQALLERRTERFESVHPLAESQRRLEAALERARVPRDDRFVPRWSENAGRAVLDAEFLPPLRVQAWLRFFSLGMLALILASGYAIARLQGSVRFLLPLVTLLAILAFPLFTLALNSQREARESRIRRAIRVALLDADEKFPPPQRWADED